MLGGAYIHFNNPPFQNLTSNVPRFARYITRFCLAQAYFWHTAYRAFERFAPCVNLPRLYSKIALLLGGWFGNHLADEIGKLFSAVINSETSGGSFHCLQALRRL